MNDLAWWSPTQAALQAIVDVLPRELQNRVVEQLKQTAVVAADKGDTATEFFCRSLSGEPAPAARPALRTAQSPLRLIVSN